MHIFYLQQKPTIITSKEANTQYKSDLLKPLPTNRVADEYNKETLND